MTFKKGFGVGVVLGLIMVFLGYLFVNKIDKESKEMATIDLQELVYKDMDGKEVKLSDYEGEKNVLLNCWATWCKPCIAEFPLLDEAYEIVKDDFVFLAVSDESIEKINKFIAKKPYKFTYLKTEKFLLNGITSLPKTYILNKKLETKKYHPKVFKGTATELADSLRLWVQ